MSELQLGLFESAPAVARVDPPAEQARKMARRSHPETSRQAAEQKAKSRTVTRDEDDAISVILAQPGMTAAEIDQFDRVRDPKDRRLGKRLGGLANEKRLVRGPSRICSAKGTKAQTWFTVEQAMVGSDVMPDADTCSGTPKDSSGELVRAGKYVRPGPRGASIGIEVRDCLESGSLLYRPKGARDDAWMRIEQSDPSEWGKCSRVEAWTS